MSRFFQKVIEIILTIVLIVIILYFGLNVGDVLIKSIQHIDLDVYDEKVDYGVLSEEQIETFDKIIYAVENRETDITCPPYSDEERHEIITHLGLYFGDTKEVIDLVHWNGDGASLNSSIFKKLLDQKAIIDARIDEAVSTLIEGSDEYKLWQISNYISARIVYTEDFRNTISALNGKGVCESYAMLFYKMATRLGIQTYICYGYAGDGYHAWNMVDLDGEYRYFDVTWYDGVRHNIRYIFGKSSWDRKFQINNRWSTDLEESN